MNRDVCYEMLRMFGCTVAEAGDGVAAVSAVREARARGRPFDAVLMDVQMPHKNGTEATAAIRVMEAEADRILGVVERLPIVALTGSAATPTTPHTHSPLDACMDACTVLTVWCVTLCALQVRRLGGARALPGQRDGRLHDQADRLRRDSSHPLRGLVRKAESFRRRQRRGSDPSCCAPSSSAHADCRTTSLAGSQRPSERPDAKATQPTMSEPMLSGAKRPMPHQPSGCSLDSLLPRSMAPHSHQRPVPIMPSLPLGGHTPSLSLARTVSSKSDLSSLGSESAAPATTSAPLVRRRHVVTHAAHDAGSSSEPLLRRSSGESGSSNSSSSASRSCSHYHSSSASHPCSRSNFSPPSHPCSRSNFSSPSHLSLTFAAAPIAPPPPLTLATPRAPHQPASKGMALLQRRLCALRRRSHGRSSTQLEWCARGHFAPNLAPIPLMVPTR
jgi:CheY-like chemotaxis protein